jgi:ABC-type branched-subunit amino acid transport system substrate-binding protein
LKTLLGGTALLGSATVLGACSGNSDTGLGATSAISPGATNPFGSASAGGKGEVAKVALLLPLGGSSQLSLVAKGLQQAAELALFERNVENLQLVVRDDKGTAPGAAQAAMSVVADGCELILGPLLGTSVAAAAPIARQANVPMIAFSNDPANGGRGVHLLSFFASAEATRVAEHALAQGRRTFAMLAPNDALGHDMEPAFRRAVERGGGRIATSARYPAASLSGTMEAVQRVMETVKGLPDGGAPVDALFAPASADGVGRLMGQLRRHDFDATRVKLIVSSGWDTPSVLREPAFAGAWLASADPRGWQEFSARFAKTYNAMPPRLATLAYDAMAVATAFATQPRADRFTPAHLMRETSFSGVDGPFRLTQHGPIERSIAVLEVQPQGLVMVAPAGGFTPALATAAFG